VVLFNVGNPDFVAAKFNPVEKMWNKGGSVVEVPTMEIIL
jgi:hypothetical protein